MSNCLLATALTATLGWMAVSSPEDQVFDGKVVSVAEKALTVSDTRGQILQTFEIPVTTKVTLNGKPAALMELMMGDVVKVTLSGRTIKVVEAVRSIKVVTTDNLRSELFVN